MRLVRGRLALPQTLFLPSQASNSLRICYLDESGVPELAGGTHHFVLLGLSIPAESWRAKDEEIARIKQRFGLASAEIHAAWLARRYLEQESIPGFEEMSETDRRQAVQAARDLHLVGKAARLGLAAIKSDKKNFDKTRDYIHLPLAERRELLREVAEAVADWEDCRIFADCIDKRAFNGVPPRTPPFEEAFTQVVTRFHRFLQIVSEHGLFVEDNNETMAARLTELMRGFHARGTRWAQAIPQIVETPLFVDSSLTSMVQVADLCAYAVRRFCDNEERTLFGIILPRFQRESRRLVGLRHYTGQRRCTCHICRHH